MKFYKCDSCEKVIVIINETEENTVCSESDFKLIEPQTADMANEKHVPVVEQDGNNVKVYVGSTEHPMLEKHWIQWITLETNQGFHKKSLNPGDKPEVFFALAEGEKPVAAYEYCNLHGLWANNL